MSFTSGSPKPANSGRKKGARNKRTLAASPKTYPDALEHLAKAVANDDGTVTPDLKLRAAIGVATYQHPKPAPFRTETFIGPIDYTAPKTPEEARQTILDLGERMARREISVEAHDALINGIRACLNDKAAEQEQRLADLEKMIQRERDPR
jgi:hypothetical protein